MAGSFSFLLVERFFSLIRELLVMAKVCVPLLHSSGYSTMLVIVLPRHHGWVGLLAISLLWKLQVPWNLVLDEEAFRSDPACVPLSLVSEVHSAFSKRDSPSPLGSTKQKCMMFWNNPGQQPKRGFHIPGVGVLIASLWLLGGKISFKLCKHRLICIIGIFR